MNVTGGWTQDRNLFNNKVRFILKSIDHFYLTLQAKEVSLLQHRLTSCQEEDGQVQFLYGTYNQFQVIERCCSLLAKPTIDLQSQPVNSEE